MKASISVSVLLSLGISLSPLTSPVSAFSVIGISRSKSSWLSSRKNQHTVDAWSLSPRVNRRAATAAARAEAAAGKTSWRLYYDSSRDPPNTEPGMPNAWSALANTEKWLQEQLHALSGPSGQNNPYTRKEVSYVCDPSADAAMILANIFRRLKEARELGEKHGQEQEERVEELGESYEPRTLRQTLMVVIPSNPFLSENWPAFDAMVNAINQARRNSRDLMTDHHLDRLDDELSTGEADEYRDWSVSVNCAHLHPAFGSKTPEQELKELQQEEESGEVDLNYIEYQKKREAARRSPYPSVVIELRATPPPDFSSAPPPPSSSAPGAGGNAGGTSSSDKKGGVTSADIQRLEALFGKSAHLEHPTHSLDGDDPTEENNQKPLSKRKQRENDFYDSIGNSIQELSAVTPLKLAQEWIAQNSAALPSTSAVSTAAFTTTDAEQADAAYEFVFTNLAMLVSEQQQQQKADGTTSAAAAAARQYYLVMPHFCSLAATSFEKFRGEVVNILSTLPELDGVVTTTFHPEHVEPAKRSPMPILGLQWSKNASDD